MLGGFYNWVTSVAKSVFFNNNVYTYFSSNNVEDAIHELDFRELTKEPTGYPNRIDSDISFNDSTLTFTIQPTGTQFSYWSAGKEYIIDTVINCPITDTEGDWFFHFEDDQFYCSQTPWDFSDDTSNNKKAFTTFIYWDADNNKSILFLEERHGVVMDWSTHVNMHKTRGAQIVKGDFEAFNYIEKGDGSLNAHAQIAISNGRLIDEDIFNIIVHSSIPTNKFEQFLQPYAKIPLYYRVGSGTGKWRKLDATDYPVAWDGINTIKYNNYDMLTDTWSLQNVTEEWYTTTILLATNNIYEPIVGIIGTKQAVSSLQAADQDIYEVLGTFPALETYPIYRLIFLTSTLFTNMPKASLSELLTGPDTKAENDRYAVSLWYIGNAGTGKYLDSYPGSSSFESPFTFPENSFIRTVTLHVVSNSTGSIGFFKIINGIQALTPDFTVSLNNSSFIKLNLSKFFLENDEICAQVISGSFNKPTLRYWVQTDL